MAPTNMPAVSIDINMFWQIINFFILMFAFNKWLKKPLMKLIDARKEKIAEEFSAAQKNKEEATEKNKEAEQILKSAKEEATKIIQLAERKAEERKENIISEATVQRDKMIKSAELEINKMKQTAKKELEAEMSGLAVKLAEKIIKENLNSDLNAALADKFINEVGEVR